LPENHFDGDEPFAFSFCTGEAGESLDFAIVSAQPRRPTTA
jgi:hypothetical protein